MSRKNLLRPVLLTCLCLVFAAPATVAGEAHFYIVPYFQNTSFNGDGMVDGGTNFNFEDTLGLESDQVFSGVEGFGKFFGQRIQFSYHSDDTSGSETLSSDLIFNGATFGAGERISTKMDMERWELMYGFDLGFKVVNFGFLFGAQVVDINAAVDSSSGLDEEEDFHLPMPVIGFTFAAHPIDKLAIHVKVSGMSATVSNIDATLIDGFVGIDYYVVWKLGLSVGYRAFILDATDDDTNTMVDMNQTGPYLGLSLHL